MKPQKISPALKNVVRTDDECWHHYTKNPIKFPKITGKYLFFSENKNELIKIVIAELENGRFFRAKINTDENKIGKDYVLCLYYEDDSRKFELAEKYKRNNKIRYKYWKSDVDTLKGDYSTVG